MGFENYKDKQKFYKIRSKQETNFWISKPPKTMKDRGRTYVKPKEDKNDNNR